MRRPLQLHAHAIVLGAILAAAPLHAQAPDLFHLDRPHSNIGFTVRFMGLSTVRGQFTDVRGAVLYREPDITASSVTVVIQTASIHTGGGFRDRHLRSPDFFDAGKYPVITFQSRRIEKTDAGFIARGPLTMHGVTKEVAIPLVRTHGRMKDAWENVRVGFEGRLRLNRKDFGVMGTAFWNSEFDPGRFAVADSVDIELQVSAQQFNFERRSAPMSDTLLGIATASGGDAAVRRIRELNGTRTDSAVVGPMTLATVGYTLLQRERADDAIRIFKHWTETAPNDADAFDSLGDAYVRAGQLDPARRSYERALAIDPHLPSATEMLRWLRGRERGEVRGARGE